VKFDSRGRIVTTQVGSGQVLRIDVQTGAREVLADLGPGLDNVSFIGDRIFVSSIPGEITEILAPGKTRSVIPRALQWPLGLAVGADGTVFVADGAFSYTLHPDGRKELACMLFTVGGPGYIRGVATGAASGEWIVTTGLGSIARYRSGEESDWIAHGYDQLMGVATNARGAVVFAEYGTGSVHVADGTEARTLATGLDKPMGVAVIGDTIYVAEAGAGRVVALGSNGTETLVDGLARPEGLCASGDKLYIIDTLAKTLIEADPASGARHTIAENLPVGAPVGVTAKFLGPIGDMAGPMINFAGIAAGADGTLYVAADAEGSVLAIRPGG
jgi:DNA-binding beta-propeller fold protein YncE